jgi:hypothetical protein
MIYDALVWLNGRRVDHLSEIVVYSRLGYTPVSLAASIGKTTREILDESGLTIEATSIDFLVSSASLILDGSVMKPQIGDIIKVTEANGSTKTFEVLDLTGQGHYAWSDPRGLVFRIHTKLVGTAGV